MKSEANWLRHRDSKADSAEDLGVDLELVEITNAARVPTIQTRKAVFWQVSETRSFAGSMLLGMTFVLIRLIAKEDDRETHQA